MFKRVMKLVLAALVVTAGVSFAEGSLPLDMASTGTTLASYVSTAAGAGLAVFAGIFGIRVIVRAFSSVAG